MTPPTTFIKRLTVFALLITAALSFAQQPQPTAPSDDDIRPIRGEVTIPEPEVKPKISDKAKTAAAITSAILIAALLIAATRRAKSRRIPNIQLQAISALEEAQSIMRENRSRDYSISVSDIVRQFIESRFQLPVTQRTTQEFIRELTDKGEVDLGPYRQTLDHFLNQCDFGKFSGDTLNAHDMKKLHEAALDVVQCEATANEATK